MKISRRFTQNGQDALQCVQYEQRTSRISNPDGSVVFEMTDAEIPRNWSQLATDIMVSKYFRKAGVPQKDASGQPVLDSHGNALTGPEKSAKEVVHRLAGCWRYWGEKHGYFDSADDAQAFYDELAYMLLHQVCAPNSPQWFNTGLNFAYGITGPSQGHYYCDPHSGDLMRSEDAYSHPQPHACFIQAVTDDLVNSGGIMDLWTREARLFKYGSGTGSNFSKLRGENEPLSGGGKSSGLMSFLKIGDRAAGAIKSGGTTRRAAKMVCLDLDHPDIEEFVNWKVREELKVAAMAEGIKRLPKDQRQQAEKLRLKLDYDFNGEAYNTVSGQNSNNSVRIPNCFFKAVEEDGNWQLYWRTNHKKSRSLKARDLWEQIAFAAWRCADPGVQFDDTINQWHTCPKSGRINASNPCVTGDTRVLTPGGIWRRIDSMIHLPSRVMTHLDGQQVHPTDGAFPTGIKEVFELTTTGGYSVKLTADHRVFTRTRGWVAASELQTTDEVKLPNVPACLDAVGEPRAPQLFQLIGLYVSASNGDSSAVDIAACLGNDEAAASLAQYAEEQWTSPQSVGNYSAATMTLRLTNRRLLSRMSAFLRTDAGQVRLSDEAFTAGLPAQKHLLRGLFTCDAELIQVASQPALELRHGSRGLLQDLQILLLGFGVRSSLIEAATTSRSIGLHSIGLRGGMPADADSRHGLRIESGSLRSFNAYVGMLSSCKRQQLAATVSMLPMTEVADGHWDHVADFQPAGMQAVFDLTECRTSSFIANGMVVHNCSEYMFLDNTACNLASLNVLTFFDESTRSFDIEAYRHAIRIWTIVLEISVLMASFPSEEIARLSYRYRTLGLGYANLGAMLMQAGIPYDSDEARAVCGALTAVLTGESYATSAEMARELGTFAGYQDNKADMLRVIRNHRRAAYDVTRSDGPSRQRLGDFETLDIKPVGIDAHQFTQSHPLLSRQLLHTAQDCWDRALQLGERHGFRNAQVTVIAPTGTIGLLMDCDTTGVEPDFALVKFKKLAGGGYFKIANQSLRPALANLGYTAEQIHDIIKYVMGTLTLHDAPHLNYERLKMIGFTDAELAKIEMAVPGVFEIAFAFSPYLLSPDIFARLHIEPSDWQLPGFNLLKRLGFTRKQVDEANDFICGRGTVEGAPHLKPEHYAVFDCANKCGKIGKRFIAVEGHIRMMAASQPFISGAISKTINLPNEATVADIKSSYQMSWQLGLKANALYRDGSKLSQPLNVTSDQELDQTEEDDAQNVEAGRNEVALEVVNAAVAAGEVPSGIHTLAAHAITPDNITPVSTHQVEKIIERIVERPLRRRLPDTRSALTHKFDVAGHEGYITVGLYDDGQPGEVFITMAKEGSTIGGLMDTIATLVSVALQYGVPVESLVRKFEHVRFEPSGMTRNREIPIAKSLVDYIFRWLAMEFITGYRVVNAPKRSPEKNQNPASEKPRTPPTSSTGEPSPFKVAGGASSTTAADTGAQALSQTRNKNGNGNGNHPPVTSPLSSMEERTGDDDLRVKSPLINGEGASISSRLVTVADPLSQQGSEMQTDAPACDVCGSITVRSGTCYKCLNCGNSMGCS